MRVVIGLVSLMFIWSCSNDSVKSNINELDDNYTLVNTSSITLALDSVQGFFNNSLSHLKLSDGSKYFSMLNKTNGIIYYYSAETGDLTRKVQLEIGQGLNGIGTNLDQIMHANISKDSIFLYNGWSTKMFLLNDRGEVLRTYLYTESDLYLNEGQFGISTTNDNRPFVLGNKVYMNLIYRPTEYRDKRVLLELDLLSGNFNTRITPSPLYLEDCWGTSFSLNSLSTYDSDNDQFVFSFGVDPNVYRWSKDKLVDKKYLGSKFFDCKPFSSDIGDYMVESSYAKRSEYSQLSPKFYKIIYLRRPRVFLREAFLERSRNDKALGVRGLKKTFIIADKNLNRLGEFRVPDDKYFTSNFFVSDIGVYLADLDYYNNNEDSLKLDLYEPKEIEK